MKKTIKNYCLTATQNKINELYEIAARYAAVKNEVFHRYSSITGIQYISYPRKIRDEWVRSKYANRFRLQARYWKQSLDEAFSNIRSKWSNTFRKVRSALYKNQRFNKEERHYAFYLFKKIDLLYQVLTYTEFDIPEKFKNSQIDRQKVHKYLKSRLRNYFGKKPKQGKKTSFMIDTAMYDVKTDQKGRLWLAIAGLTPRKRIRLLLTSKQTVTGTLRIVLHNHRIEIHNAVETPTKSQQGSGAIGIDKGLTTLLATSSGNEYGKRFGEILETESDRLSLKNSNRNKLRALLEKHEETGHTIKAELIRQNNLGKKKYFHQKEINLDKIKAEINLALNTFLKQENPAILVSENLVFYNWTKEYSKKVKRYFSSWLKGYLRTRIDFKTMLNGVQQVVVNAAYTSQVCHLCGEFGIRKGDKFYCTKHREINAHYNAAKNILARMYDSEITKFTNYRVVKKILQERLRLSNQDSRYDTTISESEKIHTYI